MERVQGSMASFHYSLTLTLGCWVDVCVFFAGESGIWGKLHRSETGRKSLIMLAGLIPYPGKFCSEELGRNTESNEPYAG